MTILNELIGITGENLDEKLKRLNFKMLSLVGRGEITEEDHELVNWLIQNEVSRSRYRGRPERREVRT